MDEVIKLPTAEEIEEWLIDACNDAGSYIPPSERRVIAQHILERLNGSRVRVLDRIKDQSHGL